MNVHQHLIGQHTLLSMAFMTISYVMYFIADILIVRTGFQRRTFGQAPVPAGILLGSAIAALIGPFTNQHHLFPYGLHDRGYLLVIWLLSVVLQGLIFAQYFAYSKGVPDGRRWLLGSIATAGAFVFSWLFIAFYQDLYVNEIFAIATLLMAVGYVVSLSPHSELRGMPVSGAWLYTGAITFAELGTWVGSMAAAYPEAEPDVRKEAVRKIAELRGMRLEETQLRAAAEAPDAGYTFIYFLWIAASVLMAWYAWNLQKRERRGAPNA
jgi:hypothetical protein